MALGAMANHPNLQVKILPVGLSYFHPHRFRSRAVVEFGSPLDVPAEFVEMYKEGGAQKREAVAKVLDLVYDALKTVTIRAPDYDTLMVAPMVQTIWHLLILALVANTSCTKTVQNPWTAFDVRSSRRAQQAFLGGLFPFQRRAARPEAPNRCPQVQSACS
jgi:hypothetical protein